MRIPVLAFAAVALGAAIPAIAAAQTQPPAGLIRLHDALHLTSDQEGAWKAYAAAVTPSQDARARHRAADAMMPTLTAPRRVALMESMMTEDMADLRRAGQGVIAFYDRLTPAQRRIFDDETARPQDGYAREP